MYIPLFFLIGCSDSESKKDILSEETETLQNDSILDKKQTEQEKEQSKEKKAMTGNNVDSNFIKLVSIDRFGKVPPLKDSKVIPVEGVKCHYSVDMQHAKLYSNFRMKRYGAPNSISPLNVSYNGKLLEQSSVRVMKESQEKGSCNGAFYFPNKDIIISAPSEEPILPENVKVALSTEFPILRTSTDLWWIYTKNTVRVVIQEDKSLVNKEIKIDAKLRRIGGSEVSPVMVVNKEEKKFSFKKDDNTFVFQDTFVVPTKASVLLIQTPFGCSDMLIEQLSLTVDGKEYSLLDKGLVSTEEK